MSTVIEAPRVSRPARAATKVSATLLWAALAVVVGGVVLAVLWGLRSAAEATGSAQAVSPVLGAVSLVLVSLVVAVTLVFIALLHRAQGVG